MTHRFGEAWIFLQELYHAVGKLRVVTHQRLDLVQGNENSQQELFVFFLQREGKSIDDAARRKILTHWARALVGRVGWSGRSNSH